MKNKIILLFIGLICLFPAVAPFFDSRMPTFHDETQIANIHQYHQALSLGQFPPRWASDMHFQYGSPFLEFNYQLPYYLTYTLSQLGLSITWSFKMVMVLSLLVGFIGFFLLSLQFASPSIALLGGLVYSYTPYRAVNLFVRGSLGESLALAIFPFILLFLVRLNKKPSLKDAVFVGISASLLFITHQPATILALPFIYIFSMGLALLTRRLKSFFLQIFSGVLALLLALFYWLPAILEKRYLAQTSPFNFYDHFPFIKQLIYSPWNYGGSVWGPYDNMSFQIGLINLLFIVIAIIVLILMIIWKKTKAGSFLPILLTLFVTALAVFLMNIRSSFFWNIFPFTQEIQFPWRLLMTTTLFTPLLGVLALPLLPLSKKYLHLLVFCLSFSAIALNMFYFRPGDVLNRDDNFFLRSFLPVTALKPGETVSPLYLKHNEDYALLPNTAVSPVSLPESKITAVLPDTEITADTSNPYHIKAKILSPFQDKITIHTFYFPGWLVYLDGSPTAITLNYYGAMTLVVPSGSHELLVRFTDTPVRQISNIISLGSWVIAGVCLCLTFASKRGKRRN